VLFGVPGTSGAAATVLDGHPMAQRGEAARALSAGYAASLLGGLVGALILAVSLPFLRPLILHVGAPELVGLTALGLSSVSALSGRAPLLGMAAAGFGLLAGLVGAGPNLGTLRWTFDTTYLWDGLPLVPAALGLFAVPELASLAAKRGAIATRATDGSTGRGVRQGIADVVRRPWLALRCSSIGALLGAVPGIGLSAVDWIAYGHAARTEREPERFGKGDVRGVIAAETANNATTGGALIPTIAFGVPGSASMALLLGAFLIHGLVPGPAMLTTNLDVTYAMIWTLVIANALGAAICLASSAMLGRIASIRFSLLVPAALACVLVSSFQTNASWGDLWTLAGFAAVGLLMKRHGWPRPPLILGFVLAPILERYLHISVQRYGADWLLEPSVIGLFAVSGWFLVPPLVRSLRRGSADPGAASRATPGALAFAVAALVGAGTALIVAATWPIGDGRVPMVIASGTFLALAAWTAPRLVGLSTRHAPGDAPSLAEDLHGVPRFALVLGTLLGLVALLGLLPAIFVFVVGYMVHEGGERLRVAMTTAGLISISCWLVFDRWLALPWPRSVLGDWLPALRTATGLV
ncbi:MAG: tripartite tricarboxylate transporter permease, partial [Pseudomonadota bacterium]